MTELKSRLEIGICFVDRLSYFIKFRSDTVSLLSFNNFDVPKQEEEGSRKEESSLRGSSNADFLSRRFIHQEWLQKGLQSSPNCSNANEHSTEISYSVTSKNRTLPRFFYFLYFSATESTEVIYITFDYNIVTIYSII